MSSSVSELKQDINALRKEINGLKTKVSILKASIRRKKHPPKSKIRKPQEKVDKIVTDLESLFARFPQLRDLFYSDHGFNGEDNAKIHSRLYNEGNRTDLHVRSPSTSMSLTGSIPETDKVIRNQSSPVRPRKLDTDSLNALNLQILSSPPSKQPERSYQTANKPISITTLSEQLLVESTYRFFGITIFPAMDPNDMQIEAQTGAINMANEMLGVRLDLFDDATLTFDTPFYIMLKRYDPESKCPPENPNNIDNPNRVYHWKLFKHSVPNYIDIHRIMNQICTGNSSNDMTPYLTLPDIQLFAKEIYTTLLREKCRRQYLKTLEEKGVISQLDSDIRTRKIMFEVDGVRIRVFLDDGIIVSCSVLRGLYDHQKRSKWEIMLNGPLEDLEYKLQGLT